MNQESKRVIIKWIKNRRLRDSNGNWWILDEPGGSPIEGPYFKESVINARMWDMAGPMLRTLLKEARDESQKEESSG